MLDWLDWEINNDPRREFPMSSHDASVALTWSVIETWPESVRVQAEAGR